VENREAQKLAGKRAAQRYKSRIGEAIKQARLARDMTQSALAAAIGVDIKTVNTIERGGQIPKLSTAESIADILAVELDQLVGRTAPTQTVRLMPRIEPPPPWLTPEGLGERVAELERSGLETAKVARDALALAQQLRDAQSSLQKRRGAS